MLKDLVRQSRSYRRFYEEAPIEMEALRELVNLARLSPSAGNKQPLRFMLSADAERNARIFPTLFWARALKDWPGPAEGERPSAYVIVLGDTETAQSFGYDAGIAAQTILLGAVEKGFGGCMLSSVKRDDLRQSLLIDGRYEIVLVIALGKPKEQVILETVGPDGKTEYWRDAEQGHHVPKRTLQDLIVG